MAVLVTPAAASAASCPAQAATQAFSRFGDSSDYALLSGGRFENSLTWGRSGYAGLYGQNNPYHLSGHGSASVRLRDEDAVVSPSFCVSKDHPHMRFVARALNTDSQLDVHLLWTDASGVYREYEIAELAQREYLDWRPSPQVPLGTRLPTSNGQIYNVRLRFTLDDDDGSWLIDDVYIDPRASR